MSFSAKKILPRYYIVMILLVIVGIGILVKTAHIMFVKRDYWKQVSERSAPGSFRLRPMRGSIYSSDGQLLVSSLPEYNLCMEYICTEKDSALRARTQLWRDTMIAAKADSVGEGLHKLFPEVSAKAFTKRFKEGRKAGRRYWKLYKKRVSYEQFLEVKKLPFFRESQNKTGFYGERIYKRTKPFGTLAGRTLGEIDAVADTARSGLELSYDSVLRGKWGKYHLQKVQNNHLKIVDIPKEDGCDIISTLDVEMQDLVEKALEEKLQEKETRIGLAVLMEVETGDIKAIVNLTRGNDGKYRETRNYAVSNLLEPGSVFKTASFMVAFDDGYLHPDDRVNTGNGERYMYGERMTDDGRQKTGGWGEITAAECIQKSSNVGVSYFIDKFYSNQPEKFVDGLHRIGIAADLKIPLKGYAVPRIRDPRKNRKNWWKGTTAWMSIGYATQVPPISTLTFYNGIANGGKMVRPRFVKSVVKNGKTVCEYPVEVVRQRMCSPQALSDVKKCLELVVMKGTGKKARSKNFTAAGKTGTAQIWEVTGKTREFLVSFVGYFPADKPKYSCIVCFKRPYPASGGSDCAPVFRRISEAVMAKTTEISLTELRDTINTVWPHTKNGDTQAAKDVLAELHIPYSGTNDKKWSTTTTNEAEVVLHDTETETDVVPDVIGMGLRDALFILEHKGIRVSAKGVGKVTSQSIPTGTHFKKGQLMHITLERTNDKLTKKRPKTVVADTTKHTNIPDSAINNVTGETGKKIPDTTGKKSASKTK